MKRPFNLLSFPLYVIQTKGKTFETNPLPSTKTQVTPSVCETRLFHTENSIPVVSFQSFMDFQISLSLTDVRITDFCSGIVDAYKDGSTNRRPEKVEILVGDSQGKTPHS